MKSFIVIALAVILVIALAGVSFAVDVDVGPVLYEVSAKIEHIEGILIGSKDMGAAPAYAVDHKSTCTCGAGSHLTTIDDTEKPIMITAQGTTPSTEKEGGDIYASTEPRFSSI